MSSDIVLNDDETITVVGAGIGFRSTDGTAVTPVIVRGRLVFLSRVFVHGPPPATSTGLDVKGRRASGLTGQLGVVEGSFDKLRAMEAPYDVFELLTTLRSALLDLERRVR